MKNRLERYFTLSDFLNLLEGERQSLICSTGCTDNAGSAPAPGKP
jgi:hypothetical protein